MQEIITEILERHGFPTKNVEELVEELQKWDIWLKSELESLVILGDNEQILGYSINGTPCELDCLEEVPLFIDDLTRCEIGSELVARLKGGDGC
jgi:hypothetical protein